MEQKSDKKNVIAKVLFIILSIFLILEIIPVIIGIIKWQQGDPNFWGYMVLPSMSILTTVIILIPIFFLAKMNSKNKVDDFSDNEEEKTDSK